MANKNEPIWLVFISIQLFFNPQALAHAEAVIKHLTKQPVQHTMHATHQVTREWGDNAISQIANNRANVPFKQRRAN